MTAEENENAEIAQAEKFGLGDLVIAALIAAAVWVAQSYLEYPGLYPGVWNDAAVAAGVRPATDLLSGLWVFVAHGVFRHAGLNGGIAWLRLLGHATMAVTAFCVYGIMREVLTVIMRARPQVSPRRAVVVRMASIVGSLAFVSMDPVWTAGQFLSGTTILLALTVTALAAYFLFLRKGRLFFAYVGAGLLGLLAAEAPFGFLLPILLIALYLFVAKVLPNLESPLFKPAVMEVGKWYMTFIYFAALTAGIAVNCWMFVLHGGLGAIGETLGYLPLAYVLGYWNQIVSAAGLVAWLMLAAICFVPFVVTMVRFPVAADEERFLPYATGLIILFCSALALSQAGFLPALWFWTYFPVDSQYLLSVGLFCCAFTIAGGMTTLGVDALCRDHQRLAKVLYGNEDEDAEAVGGGRISRSTTVIRRVCILVVPLFALGVMVPIRFNATSREMLKVVHDGLREIVREAGEARYLFSDGAMDPAIEFESAAAGGHLKCYSLMGGGDAMAAYLRTRGLTGDEEDRFAFGFDTAMGLRSWIRDRPEKLTQSAVMMGFDLWKRDGKPLPPMGGMLSRPSGFANEDERQAGIKAAHALADRILAIYNRRGGIKACTDESVLRAFVAVQWRVSRMCTYRSEYDDLVGKVDSSVRESRRAKELNDRNPTYKRLVESVEKRKETLMQKVTPREGLQLALVRADFTLGKVYAETVIGVEPDNPDANFALGMYHLTKGQYALAETYLKRCLIRKPNEPAVYNNLAMIQISQHRFDVAEMNIRKALALMPNSAAVLDTKRMLEKAREEAKKGK